MVRISRGLLTASIVVGLALGSMLVAQNMKAHKATTTHKKVPILVNSVDQVCVDMDSPGGYDGDWVEWSIDSQSPNPVKDFHIIFIKKSPFVNHERYFDKTQYKSSALISPKPPSKQEAFEYVISVHVNGAHDISCDPHVIVIKGTDD